MIEAGASAYCIKGGPLWELERAIAGAGEPLFRLGQALARAQHDSVGTAGRPRGRRADQGALRGHLPLVLRGRAFPGRPRRRADTRPFHERTGRRRPRLPRGDLGRGRRARARGALPPRDPVRRRARRAADRRGRPARRAARRDAGQRGLELDAAVVAEAADLAARSLALERRAALTFAEARRDALTGLPNRRAFDEHLDDLHRDGRRRPRAPRHRRLQAGQRHARPCGRRRGALDARARVLLRTVRANEQVFRLGGDEFAVVIADDTSAAERAGERILRAVRRHRRGLELPTLSAGLAHAPRRHRHEEGLYARADAALYDAKGAGRDQLVVADETDAGAGARVSYPRRRRFRAAAALPGTRPLRLLIVDDDPGLLMLLRTTFEIIDLDVDEAQNAAQAEAQIARAAAGRDRPRRRRCRG